MLKKLLSKLRRRHAALAFQSAVSVFQKAIKQLDAAYDSLNEEVVDAIVRESDLYNQIDALKSDREVLSLELDAILAQRKKIESILA